MLKYIDEYRDPKLCGDIAERIRESAAGRLNIMEVCGGHTMAIRKHGIHRLVGKDIRLISGPGCPVCVTSIEDIDRAISFSKIDGICICTFGDLLRVPGAESTLSDARAEGADVRVVYSVHDVLEFARREPEKNFIFISIGFETTAPTTAACVKEAKIAGVSNFFIYSLNKTMPNALSAILRSKDANIDALILPGHVSAITGSSIYRFISDELKIPCCISGFEPSDILSSIYMITEMVNKNAPDIENSYRRAVPANGNEKARALMSEVFDECDVNWRGIGSIPLSGLRLKGEYSCFDALGKFEIDPPASADNEACICGDILRGAKRPSDCSLFGNVCNPSKPKGACMVSSEGSCAAWYKYGSD